MNIFYLSEDMAQCARYHCNKHVVKMILEYAQMLCTVVNESGGRSPYKSTHKNHTCTQWVRKSLSNWRWLKNFVSVLNQEKIYRYGTTHKSAIVVRNLQEPNIPDIGLTEFPQAMGNVYRVGKNPIKAYRRFYICEKKQFAEWKNRPIPFFMY